MVAASERRYVRQMRIVERQFIAAPPEIVWDLTVDVVNLPAVTPTMTRVEPLEPGPIGVGSRVRITQPMQRPAVWTVTRVDPFIEFAWRRSLLAGAMTGSHRLEPVNDGTLNELEIKLVGPAGSLIGALAGRLIRRTLRTENEGLRKRAEELAAEER